MNNLRFWILMSLFLVGTVAMPVQAQLTELAWYRLGDSDDGAADGQAVTESINELEGPAGEMTTFGDVYYSNDTPDYITSGLSVLFDGDFENNLFTDATPWHTFYPGYRVGMEAFVKIDPEMEGIDTVPFGNGTGYWLSAGADGYYHAHGFLTTPPGATEIKYGEWQHVAFLTGGSDWQIFVDGVPQYSGALPPGNYGSPGGNATIGSDKDGGSEFIGLIDEHRVFTWTGSFNTADLLYYTLRGKGDVNEDGSVDQVDYDIWRTNVGGDLDGLTVLEARGLGDLNGDRLIDLDDFAEIKANKTPGALWLVPEPASNLLLVMGIALLGLRRRRGL